MNLLIRRLDKLEQQVMPSAFIVEQLIANDEAEFPALREARIAEKGYSADTAVLWVHILVVDPQEQTHG